MCKKNWFAEELYTPVQTAKSEVTAVIIALLRLSSAANVVRCIAESTGITVVSNPSSGDALADLRAQNTLAALVP